MAFDNSTAATVESVETTVPSAGYAPLSSVWEGGDGELLEAMFEFYATIPWSRSWTQPTMLANFAKGR